MTSRTADAEADAASLTAKRGLYERRVLAHHAYFPMAFPHRPSRSRQASFWPSEPTLRSGTFSSNSQ